jgi:hypothetical protein
LANALGIKRDSRVSIKFDEQQKCLILRKLWTVLSLVSFIL